MQDDSLDPKATTSPFLSDLYWDAAKESLSAETERPLGCEEKIDGVELDQTHSFRSGNSTELEWFAHNYFNSM